MSTPEEAVQRLMGLADAYARACFDTEREHAHREQRAALESALREALQPQWLPIETAPKDGKPVLLYEPARGGSMLVGHLTAYPKPAWVTAGAFPMSPTHWMPIPQAPGAAVKDRLTAGAPQQKDSHA